MRSSSCCYGYARVSTDSQSVEAQIAALTTAGSRRRSVFPETVEPGRRQFGITNGVLDVLVPEIVLDGAGVVPGVGEFEPDTVPQHVRMYLQREFDAFRGARERLRPKLFAVIGPPRSVRNTKRESGTLSRFNPDSPDRLGRQDRRPRKRWETAGSFFHPSGPSEFGYLIQHKRLILQSKSARGAGRTPFHQVNPG